MSRCGCRSARREQRPRQPTGPGRANGPRLRSRRESGHAWRSSSRRRPGRSPAAARAPEVHIWRTSEACPASSAVQFAAISSKASSTAVCSTDVPPRSSGGCDEAPLGVEDPRRRVEGRRRRRCRPTTRRPAVVPPVPRCGQPARRGQWIADRAPDRPAGPPMPRHVQQARRSSGPVVALRPGHATSATSHGSPP